MMEEKPSFGWGPLFFPSLDTMITIHTTRTPSTAPKLAYGSPAAATARPPRCPPGRRWHEVVGDACGVRSALRLPRTQSLGRLRRRGVAASCKRALTERSFQAAAPNAAYSSAFAAPFGFGGSTR
jgi:hypothetical protein